MVVLIFILNISKWTVACYFAADNGIGQFAIQDIEELKTIGSTQSVNVVAQIDYWDTHSPSTAERYFIARDTLKFIENIGEVNTGDPKTLIEFGKWVKLNYPAEHYFLIIWDHGNGWLKGESKGVGWDETSRDWLSVAEGELTYALSGIGTVDILAFDACVMGGIEVMSAIPSYINYFIASEDKVPLSGFPYHYILTDLIKYQNTTVQIVADSVVSDYIKYYTGSNDTLSIVRVDMFCVPILAARVREFVQSLLTDPTNPIIYTARDRLREFGNMEYVDIGEFAGFIADNLSGEIEVSASRLQNTLTNCSFCKYLGEEVDGISVWFPIGYSTFMLMVYDYIELDFSKNTAWEKFMYKFYNVPDTVAPLPCEISGIEYLKNNALKINWTASYDLTAVKSYGLQELQGVEAYLNDGAEEGGINWKLNGVTISAANIHTGQKSFYSTGGSMELISPVQFEAGAMIDFFYWQNGGNIKCKWSRDTLNWITIASIITDGEPIWKWIAISLPGSGYLKLEYEATGGSWMFIDDIRVRKFGACSTVYKGEELTFNVERKEKSTYWYRVCAEDENGNKSQWSELYPISMKDRLIPYGYPSPFTHNTYIKYDIPEADNGEIYIYTLSGKLIKKLQIIGSQKEVEWDSKNSLNEEVASGIYICLLKTPTYTATFKIAKVR
ncbi:MAG: T9SS type A sorting domain-containing protein [Candidatus Stahlbacteria bacterium]|nr:T9SS type A sorting domain-containing protein [Candidatus Stahlbacteria bacterium]